MLNIITGRTGSGKTRYIRELATKIAENESGKVVIIVPEQFSFETERGMLSLLGNEKVNNVEVLSFSRIAERLLSDSGKITKKLADDSTKAVLMSMAVESLQDKLVYYKKYQKNPLLISQLIKFNRELKNCCVSVEKLSEISKSITKPVFAKKLDEISIIFQCYESLLNTDFQDDSLNLDLLADLLIDANASLKSLSKGTKEKVQLILVMSRNAKLYLLDEPIAGVDPAAREYILSTIVSNYNPEATIIITTHLITDVEQVLDDFIFVGFGGRILCAGNAEETRNESGKSLDELFKEVFRC